MPMNPRLLRPLASGVHPEAAIWRNNVIANSGSVSGSTLKAVSDFCRRIDAAGLRSKFYRLNLFCGTDLNACLVPLYRNTTAAGSVLGNSTDTNNGPFVSGDYAETGANGGLIGNGSSKYLATGFNPSTSASNDSFHLSVYASGTENTGTTRALIGSFATNQETYIGHLNNGGSQTGSIAGSNASANRIGPGATFQQGLLTIATGVGSRAGQFYVNGSTSGSSSTMAGSFLNGAIHVFAVNNNGTPGFYTSAPRLRAYSIGLGMTGADVSAFNTAMQSFQTALTRNV
jgi:hypothetical protein